MESCCELYEFSSDMSKEMALLLLQEHVFMLFYNYKYLHYCPMPCLNYQLWQGAMLDAP